MVRAIGFLCDRRCMLVPCNWAPGSILSIQVPRLILVRFVQPIETELMNKVNGMYCLIKDMNFLYLLSYIDI